jgi:hypothetical protein
MSYARYGLVLAVLVASCAAIVVGPAMAAPNEEPCQNATIDPAKTFTCTAIVTATASGPLESPTVTECLGEDFFLTIVAHILEHVVVHPGGELFGPGSLTHAQVSVHGSGYGLTSGTKTEFNETGSQVIDYLPNGDAVFHTASSATVPTQGASPNLELTLEAEIHVDPTGNTTFFQSNVQEHCGALHDSEHLHG